MTDEIKGSDTGRLDEGQTVAAVRGLTVTRLQAWVECGWVRPAERPEGAAFYDRVDVARLQLLCELHDDLGIEGDTVPVVLSLLDQVHGLRRQLRLLASAIDSQPAGVREDIAYALERLTRR